MGNKNSTTNQCELSEYGNVCEMVQCLTSNVVGLSSDSASPTDTWIVEFKDGTTYESEPIKKAFLKMWISNETLKKLNLTTQAKFKNLMSKNSGLNYEVAVYRDIVKPLIETNICPNFIKFLGAGKDCSFDDVVSMATGSNNKGSISSYEDTVFSTSVIIVNDGSTTMKRKKITDTYTSDEITRLEVSVPRKLVKDKFVYNIIANEVIKPGTISLSKFLNKTVDNKVKSKVIFQALAACYAMSCSKMCHNDLHLGNVYVEPLNKPTRMNYIYEGDLYTFETNYTAKVFDFDRTYVQRFGNNPFLDREKDWVCDDYSQCNRHIENLDALKLMSGIYRTINRSYKNDLLDICTQAEGVGVGEFAQRLGYKKLLEEVFEEGSFLTKDDVPLATDLYLKFNTTLDIMKNLSRSNFSNGSIQSTYPVGYIPDPEHTFSCNTNMFNNQGKITNLNVSKGLMDKTTIGQLKQQISELEKENEVLTEALVAQEKLLKAYLIKSEPKIPCKPGEVRDKITKKCREKKRPGPKKKINN